MHKIRYKKSDLRKRLRKYNIYTVKLYGQYLGKSPELVQIVIEKFLT